MVLCFSYKFIECYNKRNQKVQAPVTHIHKTAPAQPKLGHWTIDDTDSSSDNEDCPKAMSAIEPYLEEWNLYLNTNVTFWLDFIYYTDTSDCLFSFFFSSSHWSPCTIQIWSGSLYNTILRLVSVRYRSPRPCNLFLYNINLQATTTMISGIRGVTIPIALVISATDSI